jgi:GntR family transcriptional regulator, transcriptional repressor for pyruvate dehydrogenase complex
VRHGDAMRVRDWRSDGGLDVVAQMIFAAGGVDRPTLAAVLEARRLMLTEAARLAAQRRTEAQSERLGQLAVQLAEAPDAPAAQLLDLAFMAELVDASGNVVFVLVLNTVRRLYLDHAELLQAVVADHGELLPLYLRTAKAIANKAERRAASAVAQLAAEQERRILESLG